MRIKLFILSFICLANLNMFGQKGTSGLVPDYIPDSLIWQCGAKADGYLDGRKLCVVGDSTWGLYGRPVRPIIHGSTDWTTGVLAPWSHLGGRFDSLYVDCANIGEDLFRGAVQTYYRPYTKYIEIGPRAC